MILGIPCQPGQNASSYCPEKTLQSLCSYIGHEGQQEEEAKCHIGKPGPREADMIIGQRDQQAGNKPGLAALDIAANNVDYPDSQGACDR